jgi:hypothetical protein
LPDVTVRSFAYPDAQRILPIDRSWLSVMLKETPSGIAGSCSYKNDLFEPNIVPQWIEQYTTILAKAVSDPAAALGRLSDH